MTKPAEAAGIWHLALREGSSHLREWQGCPRLQQAQRNCWSLRLLRETGRRQMLDMQHLAALADAELRRQWKATPGRLGLP